MLKKHSLRFGLLLSASLMVLSGCADTQPDQADPQAEHVGAQAEQEDLIVDHALAMGFSDQGEALVEDDAELNAVAPEEVFVDLGTESGEGPQLLANTACCTDDDCVCRGDEPTDRLVNGNGPYRTARYTSGFRRDRGDFGGATIYYPTDVEGPLSGVVMCPGYTARQSSIAAWGPFFASHGIVFMTIDTNRTGDQVRDRARQLMAALGSLKAENTRRGSPLQGRLSSDRFGLMGWSMGGGGTWISAAANPDLKTSVALAGHHVTAGGARVANGTRVPSLMLAGARDPSILGGGGQSQAVYRAIPDSTPKILYEMRSEGHFVWGTPRTNSNASGRYVLAFQKVFLEGDQRYRKFLLERGPGASDWSSNVR